MALSLLGSRSSTIFSGHSKVRTVCAEISPSPCQSLQLVGPFGIQCSSERQGSSEAEVALGTTRRAAVVHLGSALLAFTGLLGQKVESAAAVGQSMLAGRIPGLSDPGEDAQIPVSIADLGGTEIDLRFQSASEGNISVVVAPVLRFSSQLGDNVNIEDVGVPQKIIDAFGPELTGETVEGKVKSMEKKEYGSRTYYQYELEVPHMLISATAAGNRLYLFSATGNGRQWKKFASNLKGIRDSFRVG